VQPERATYKWQGFDYSVGIQDGQAKSTPDGWSATAKQRALSLQMAQSV